MTGKRAQETIELTKPLGKTPEEVAAGRSPLGRRVLRPRNVASFLLALAVLYLVYRELLGLDWSEAWASVREANAGLIALAFAVFYSSYLVRALRWQALLANVGYDRAAGHPVPSTLGLARIMYLAWFANCVTVARLGDVYRGYLLKKKAGVSFAVTLGTVLAERLLDLLVLAAMMGTGVLLVFGESLPTEAAQALTAGLILSAVGIVGLLALRRFRWAFERVLPKRLHAHYLRFEHGAIDSFRRLPLLVAYSVVGWIIEGATLYITAAAVGTPIPVAGALLVALAASLLSTVPITPSGLGFTEAGMVLMLGWLGLDAPTAGATTLLFRIINYWSIVVFGLVLYVLGRNGNRSAKERAGTPGVSTKIHKFFTGRS
jgi:glycosyltransferase 2 family protein